MLQKLIQSDNTVYPPIFRILLGITLLVDIALTFPYLDEIYNSSNYLYEADHTFLFLKIIRDNLNCFYLLFAGVLMLFIIGIGKHFTAFLVFIFFLIKFLLLTPHITYGSYILRISLLFFVFVNSYQYLSMQKSHINPVLSSLARLSIMLHICLVYFSNGLFKALNPIWQKGDALANFFISSKTADIFGIGEFFLGFPILLTMATYFVIIFQLSIPILLWFNRTKYFIIGISIFMHITMALVLQLYFFEIVVILHYGFFIKDEEWRKLLSYIN